MRKGSIAVLTLVLAAAAPAVVQAKAYNGDGYRYSPRTHNSFRTQSRDKRKFGNRTSKGARKTYGYHKGYGYPNGAARTLGGRAMTSRNVAGLSGTGVGCLTSEARGLLGRIQAQFGNVQIVSTCRPGATIAGTGYPSKHASGQAIDFRVPGRKAEVVQWLIANDHLGGIMTYSDMDHIHVDVGQRFVALNRPSGRS